MLFVCREITSLMWRVMSRDMCLFSSTSWTGLFFLHLSNLAPMNKIPYGLYLTGVVTYLFVAMWQPWRWKNKGKQLVSNLTDSQCEVFLLHINSLTEGYFSLFILVIAAFCHSERSTCHYWAPFSRATESCGFLSVNRTPLRIHNALGKGYALIASGTCDEKQRRWNEQENLIL